MNTTGTTYAEPLTEAQKAKLWDTKAAADLAHASMWKKYFTISTAVAAVATTAAVIQTIRRLKR